MFGWILKTDWNIGSVMRWYSHKRIKAKVGEI